MICAGNDPGADFSVRAETLPPEMGSFPRDRLLFLRRGRPRRGEDEAVLVLVIESGRLL